MNNLGNEITVKIKDAIRAKLQEMNANSSDEIVDYIMLLVTTKKSSSDLTKSVDFLMENNTHIFVKWLSTIIKKLQQVTVSTAENRTPEIISEGDDVKLDNCNKKKNEIMLDLNSDMETFNGENLVKTENNLQISNTLIKTNIEDKNSDNVLKNKIIDGDEKINYKSKRPRIKINSDDEDEQNAKFISVTVKKSTKQIINMLPRKDNKASMSQVIIAKPIVSKNDIHETKKNMLMRDLIVQRVDNQRGALALDTAFKYVQQQIGASDNEIAVIKKWRDYAIEMLRFNKKV